jgi:hypothetical protein
MESTNSSRPQTNHWGAFCTGPENFAKINDPLRACGRAIQTQAMPKHYCQLLFAVIDKTWGKRAWLQTSRKSFVTFFQEKAIATLSLPFVFKGIVTIPEYGYIYMIYINISPPLL